MNEFTIVFIRMRKNIFFNDVRVLLIRKTWKTNVGFADDRLWNTITI